MFLTHYNPSNYLLRRLADLPMEVERNLVPAVDIIEKDSEWIFSVDLPGVDAKDINIEVKGADLVVSANRHGSVQQKEDSYVYTERSEGEYKRWFTLPDGADPEKVNAVTHNGVLEIKVAKRHQAQPRKIAIESRSAEEVVQ